MQSSLQKQKKWLKRNKLHSSCSPASRGASSSLSAYIKKPSPVEEGGNRKLTDEESFSFFQTPHSTANAVPPPPLGKAIQFYAEFSDPRRFFLCNMFIFYELFKKLAQRNDKQACKKIPHPVNYIERDARYYPSHRLFKTHTEHQCLRRRIQHSEGKAVDGAYDRENDAFHLFWHSLREKHSYTPQDSPDIEVRNPPYIKAGIEPVQHNVDIDRQECFFTENRRVGHREHSEQVNIRQDLHYDFRAEHYRAEHSEYRHFAYIKRRASSALRFIISCIQADMLFLRLYR